jgi:putative ABC transport system permease protein
MELGPICRALFHSKSRVILVVIEVALTLAVAVNCVVMIADQRKKIVRPTGIDEENLLVVKSEPFDPAFKDRAYLRHAIEEDLRTLRALPGVRAVSPTDQIPLSGGGSATGRKPLGTDRDRVTAPYFNMGEQSLQALGVELVAGHDFEAADYMADLDETEPAAGASPRVFNVILSQALADKLFPDGKALGSLITGRDERYQNRIIGILSRMQCSWPMGENAESSMIFAGHPGDSRSTMYLVRAEPGGRDDLRKTIEATLLRVNGGRNVEIDTMTEIKRDTYGDLISVNQLLGGMIVLLITVTSLGVIGLTAFSVTQRVRQIGTRRALGATRAGIVRHFLVENWVVTTVGTTVGVALTYALNFALGSAANVPRVGVVTVATGVVVLWLVGLTAALVPALRGAAVPPVIATRTV